MPTSKNHRLPQPELPILVVEDDQGLNLLICRRLKRLRLAVEGRADAASAQQYLTNNKVLLLLVDYSLPDGSGADLIQALPTEKRPPFIIITGRGDERLAVEMMKLGAIDYLVKDGDFLDVLPDVVERVVLDLQTQAELESARRQVRESELFAQAVLNSLSNRIAVVNADGVIEAVNASWQGQAEHYEASACGVGVNYLTTCEQSDDPYASYAKATGAGIRQVLAGERESFELEYPCPSLDDLLWFRVRVTCFPGDGPRRAVVSHEDLTEAKSMKKRAETSERLLSFALEQIPIPVVVADARDQRVLEVNAAARQLMWDPSTPSEAISVTSEHNSWKLRQPDGTPFAAEDLPLAKAIQKGQTTEQVRLVMCTPHGDHTVLVTAAPLRDNSGRVVAGIVAFTDITELENAQQALALSEARLNHFFTVAPVGFCTLRDRDITYVNPFMCDMLGYTQEELLGELRGMLFRAIESRGETQRLIQSQLQQSGSAIVESRVERRDGQIIDVIIQAVYLDPEDPGQGIVIAALDISERKKAERERVMLKSAIDQAGEAVVITDTQGLIQYVNPAFESVTGYTRDEVVGEKSTMLKSGEHDPAFYANLWKTIREGNVWLGRFHNRRKDGSLYWEEATIAPVFDADQAIVNFVATKHDITANLEMQQQLEHKDRLQAIGQLAGGIAHDFNNLLTPIIGFSSMLLAKVHETDPIHRRIREINKAADRAKALTQQLLAFSRRQVFEMEVLDLNSLVSSLQDILRGAIPEDIHIELELEPGLWHLRGNVSQLEQVIMNLVVNARDAMPDGGTLWIRTANRVITMEDVSRSTEILPGDYVELSVKDTGSGMDHATASRLFEPFFTTKEKGKGTGLGLATVYGIVHQHSGDITVRSKLAMGTTFCMRFPRTEQNLSKKAAEPTAQASIATGEQIVVVEDSAEVREIVEAILGDGGYNVIGFSTPQECLKSLKKAPDLLLTDVVMPDINGADLSERLRKRFTEMKVLFMSGYAAEQIYRRMIAIQGARLLQKPFTPVELLHKVRQALDE